MASEQAIHQAYATTGEARRIFQLDSATSAHHDQMSLQPNRAIVAILSALGDAIPFAHYLPADLGSNEATLDITSHNAGSDYGHYKQGDLMDGTLSGDTCVSSSRVHRAAIVTAGEPAEPTRAITGKLTTIQTDEETCKADAPGVKLRRGRTMYVSFAKRGFIQKSAGEQIRA